jgi:hypothetical protein
MAPAHQALAVALPATAGIEKEQFMIRKLMVACFAALAAMAMTAATASAQHGVIVEHPGHYLVESEVDLAVVTHVLGTEMRELSCDNEWEVTVNESGEGLLNAEGIFPHPNDTGQCETTEPCNHDPWPLELEENATGHPLEVHVTFCLEGTTLGLLDNVPVPVECEYDDVTDSAHCDTPILGGAFEVEGEAVLHPNELGELPIVHHG